MVLGPSLLPTRPRGVAWAFARRPHFEHQATPTRLSFAAVLARNCGCCGSYNQFRKLTTRIAAAAAGPSGPRGGPGGAPRMSSTPAEQTSVASTDGDAEIATKTVNVVIKGKVQGVYYRNWTVDSAQQLGVNGWVRNLKDGSVEAVFSGKPAIVDSLIQKCHTGPSAARVSNVEVSAWKDEVSQGFERKPTIW